MFIFLHDKLHEQQIIFLSLQIGYFSCFLYLFRHFLEGLEAREAYGSMKFADPGDGGQGQRPHNHDMIKVTQTVLQMDGK